MSEKQEFIIEKEYELLSEATYIDKSGIGKKTKKVKLLAVKIEDGEEVSRIINNENGIAKALELLSEKGYIVAFGEEGKLLSSSLHFRAARELFAEYYDAFF
jgi:hypothetical protein